jgi:hypothetical protein
LLLSSSRSNTRPFASIAATNSMTKLNKERHMIKIELDNCQIANLTISQIQELCFTLHPELKDLNPDSDYTEQYFDIQCSADSITVVFRKEE